MEFGCQQYECWRFVRCKYLKNDIFFLCVYLSYFHIRILFYESSKKSAQQQCTIILIIREFNLTDGEWGEPSVRCRVCDGWENSIKTHLAYIHSWFIVRRWPWVSSPRFRLEMEMEDRRSRTEIDNNSLHAGAKRRFGSFHSGDSMKTTWNFIDEPSEIFPIINSILLISKLFLFVCWLFFDWKFSPFPWKTLRLSESRSNFTLSSMF